MEKIRLFDATGKLLAEADQKHYKRFSMTAAANQKILDSLITKHPSGTKATIGPYNFFVKNGKSQVDMSEVI